MLIRIPNYMVSKINDGVVGMKIARCASGGGQFAYICFLNRHYIFCSIDLVRLVEFRKRTVIDYYVHSKSLTVSGTRCTEDKYEI